MPLAKPVPELTGDALISEPPVALAPEGGLEEGLDVFAMDR